MQRRKGQTTDRLVIFKGGLTSESFPLLLYPPKMLQITINLKKDAQDSDLAHFIGDGARVETSLVETFLTFSYL